MKRIVLLCLLVLTSSSCIPFPVGQPGSCVINDETINTYSLQNVWVLDVQITTGQGRMLYFEFPSLTAENPDEDCEDFNGDGIPDCQLSLYCRFLGQFVDGAFYPGSPDFAGAYFQDQGSKKIYSAEVQNGETLNDASDEVIDYSFSGSCGQTKLTIERQSGARETYRLFNYDKSLLQQACQNKAGT